MEKAKKALTTDELDLAFALARGREAGLVKDAAPDKAPTPKVIIVRESVRESVITDGVTFGCLIASVAIGRYLDSGALQWIAGLMFVVFLLGRSIRDGAKRFFTIAEARAELDRLEKEGK
jgi:hypothetical protein